MFTSSHSEKPTPRPIKKSNTAILFDLDGTLVQFQVSPRALNALKEKLGGLFQKDIACFRYILKGIETARAEMGAISEEQAQQRFKTAMALYRAFELKAARQAISKPQARNILKRFSARYPLAIISNNSKAAIELALANTGIQANLFAVILSGEEVAQQKPGGEPILKCLALFLARFPELTRCFMVGDHVYDIQSVRDAVSRLSEITPAQIEIRSIAITGGLCQREDLLKEHPDYIIDSFQELKDILPI